MPIVFTLQQTLKKYDITQRQLAELSETRPSTISQIYNGTTKRVNIDMLERIIPALSELTGEEINLSDIFTYTK